MSEILIEAKLVGKKKSLVPQWGIPMPEDWRDGKKPITLRDLITRVVSVEFDKFQTRQKESNFVQFLSEKEISDALVTGKVKLGEGETQHTYTKDQVIGIALQAFEDGLYFVFIGDDQYTELDQVVLVIGDVHITFLRLVALAGG